MDDKIENVKTFFRREILDNQIKNGDSVLLVGFYGRQTLLADVAVTGPETRRTLLNALASLQADGPYTDIGSAIDYTVEYVGSHPRKGSRQHFILLTDGIQESPPWSPYQGPKGFISHPFLDNAKTLSRSGWKIQILGIGSETAAESLAEELSGSVKVWDDSQSMLKEAPPDLLSELRLVSPPEIAQGPAGTLMRFRVEALNLSGPMTVSVSALDFLPADGSSAMELGSGLFLDLPQDGVHTWEIPLTREQVTLVAGKAGEAVFTFRGESAISPGRFDLSFPALAVQPGEAEASQEGISWNSLVFFLICFILVVSLAAGLRRLAWGSKKEDDGVTKQP